MEKKQLAVYRPEVIVRTALGQTYRIHSLQLFYTQGDEFAVVSAPLVLQWQEYHAQDNTPRDISSRWAWCDLAIERVGSKGRDIQENMKLLKRLTKATGCDDAARFARENAFHHALFSPDVTFQAALKCKARHMRLDDNFCFVPIANF
jgi:hypothetical protein